MREPKGTLNPFEWANFFAAFDCTITDRFHGTIFLGVEWNSGYFHRYIAPPIDVLKARLIASAGILGISFSHLDFHECNRDINVVLNRCDQVMEQWDLETVQRRANELREEQHRFQQLIRSAVDEGVPIREFVQN